MKKALALILCVLMMASCMVFSSSAAPAAGYDFRQLAIKEAPNTYLKTYVATAPVIDGVVNEGEYTETLTFTPDTDATLTLDLGSIGMTEFVTNYAHDANYVYVGVEMTTTAVKPLELILQVCGYDARQIVVNDTIKRTGLDPLRKYNADGTPQAGSSFKGNDGATWTEADVLTRAAYSNDQLTRTFEYRISKYLLKAYGVFQGLAENTDFVLPAMQIAYHLIADNGSFIWYQMSGDRIGEMGANGDGGRSSGMIHVALGDYNFAENQMNDGAALFAGPKLAPENAPVIDGKISEGEYYSSKTFTSGNLPAFFGEQATLNSADVKKVTYHTAQDGENVYLALEVEKNAAPKVKRYDRFQLQYGMANIANQKADTNFLNRDVPMITFDDANGQGAVYYCNSSIYDEANDKYTHGNVWERDFTKIKYASIVAAHAGAATEDFRITVYEYKINFERLASVYTQWVGTKDNLEQVACKDFLAIAIVYDKANTASAEWAGVGNWLWYKPSLSTKAAMDYMNDVRADNAQQPTWGMLPIFLFAENGVSTQETASVRISSTKAGLRFKTTVSKFEIQELVNKYGYADVQVGTLIAPTDKLDGALTHESGTAGVDYLDVKADIANPFAATNMAYTFAGSITNIKKANLDRDFTAVGYIAYTNAAGETTYIYSASVSTRNVSAVATAALADETANYTEDQKIILGNLVAAK